MAVTSHSIFRGVAQPGSALALGARGPRFESARPDQFLIAYRAADLLIAVTSLQGDKVGRARGRAGEDGEVQSVSGNL